MKAEKKLLDAQKILVIPDIHGRTFWEELSDREMQELRIT